MAEIHLNAGNISRAPRSCCSALLGRRLFEVLCAGSAHQKMCTLCGLLLLWPIMLCIQTCSSADPSCNFVPISSFSPREPLLTGSFCLLWIFLWKLYKCLRGQIPADQQCLTPANTPHSPAAQFELYHFHMDGVASIRCFLSRAVEQVYLTKWRVTVKSCVKLCVHHLMLKTEPFTS